MMFTMEITVKILLFVLLCKVCNADITGTNPPKDTCLCIYSDNVPIRERECSSEVLANGNFGDCYQYQGQTDNCTINSTIYQYYRLDLRGRDGWVNGQNLTESDGFLCEPAKMPEKEFRGLWIATVANIDWPSSMNLTTAQQQEELLNYINLMAELKMNAVIFQIRPAGDALYNSSLEPWSKWLTGTQGQAPDPFWDPLNFTVQECHRRNIEVHAWFNPFRASKQPNWEGLDSSHMAHRFRRYAYPYGTHLWMDPGSYEVQDHLLAVIQDVITRYDVDAVHWDDYFYPYPVRVNKTSIPFPDNQTYSEYVNGGGQLSLEDWRRDNTNRIVLGAYNLVKSLPRRVKFGISPFGLYRPGHPDGQPSPPIKGFDQYSKLYADAKLWLENGWLDYMAPQLYWKIALPAQSYFVLLDWWLSINPLQRHIYPGNAVYKIIPSERDWDVSEITRQIEMTRRFQNAEALGNIIFSAKYFRDNNKNITDIFKDSVYRTSVPIPDMPWMNP